LSSNSNDSADTHLSTSNKHPPKGSSIFSVWPKALFSKAFARYAHLCKIANPCNLSSHAIGNSHLSRPPASLTKTLSGTAQIPGIGL